MFLEIPTIFFQLFVLAAVSGIFAYFLFKGGIYFFEKWGLLDNPGPYGHKRLPVPHGFGILLYLHFLLTSVVASFFGIIESYEKLFVLWGLGGILVLVSFIDDLDTIFKFDRSQKSKPIETSDELSAVKKTGFSVSPKVRLAMQVCIGAIVGLTSIKISYMSSLFGGIIHLESWVVSIGSFDIFVIPLVFTIIWYVLVFNSVNWSDGVPGLTVGLSAITLFVILILTIRFYVLDATPALRENSIFVFFILSVLLPAVVLLWRYNLVPKVLLGDSGTLFLAFMIASLALLVGGKIATVATALGVYLIDAIYVIFARIFNGKNPLKGDRIHHLHYRLKSLGMSDSAIRGFVYVIALFFGISAAFLDKTGKMLLFVGLVLFIFFITKLLSLKK